MYEARHKAGSVSTGSSSTKTKLPRQHQSDTQSQDRGSAGVHEGKGRHEGGGDAGCRVTKTTATTHRVGKPADGSHRTTARVSFPIAVYVWEDEILKVLSGLGAPKYEPIKAITFHTHSTAKFYGDAYAVTDSAPDNATRWRLPRRRLRSR